MTNGADKHSGPGGKKKTIKKGSPKDVKAVLKRKNLLPAALDTSKKGSAGSS